MLYVVVGVGVVLVKCWRWMVMVLVFREHFYPIVATTIVGSSTDTPKWRLFRRRVYVYMPVEQVYTGCAMFM